MCEINPVLIAEVEERRTGCWTDNLLDLRNRVPVDGEAVIVVIRVHYSPILNRVENLSLGNHESE